MGERRGRERSQARTALKVPNTRKDGIAWARGEHDMVIDTCIKREDRYTCRGRPGVMTKAGLSIGHAQNGL